MGLFSNFNKDKNKVNNEKKQNQEQRFHQDVSQEIDPTVRPGGVFTIQLLMKERCEMPSNEKVLEVLTKYLGSVERFGDKRDSFMNFISNDYSYDTGYGIIKPILTIFDCNEFLFENIDDFNRSQMWDCLDERDDILSECKYQVVACDILGGGLASGVRANMLMYYLDALVELYPQCEAIYNLNSGKLILADEVRKKEILGLNRFIRFAVNVRLFNVEGKEDKIVDTLGLSTVCIQDLQYHFRGMDPNWVVNHAYVMACYLLNNDNPIKDGDTIDGIRDGEIVQDIQWKCQYEHALVQPFRKVIDICMDEYAAGIME